MVDQNPLLNMFSIFNIYVPESIKFAVVGTKKWTSVDKRSNSLKREASLNIFPPEREPSNFDPLYLTNISQADLIYVLMYVCAQIVWVISFFP